MRARSAADEVVPVSRHRMINHLATLLAGLRALELEVCDPLPRDQRVWVQTTVAMLVEVLDDMMKELGEHVGARSMSEVATG